MKRDISFENTVKKFPGDGGWVYVDVPKKHKLFLKQKRHAWGMCPIKVRVGNTSWETKLMTKKGGDFFVALKSSIRKQEKISVGTEIIISFRLI